MKADAAWSALHAILALLALVVAGGVLLNRRAAIRQTTLSGAWWWALAAAIAWPGAELAAALAPPAAAWVEPLRLAATTLSFCPLVALLGAKRPQHLAWNLVVVSLWAIVALPAAEAFFLRGGQRFEVGTVRAWFLWILIALGPINFVPTRYWLASLLVAAGQAAALSPFLALLERPLVPQPALAGLALAAAGCAAAQAAFRRPGQPVRSYDRLWLDFRDSFGLLWALRVQERVNAAAAQYGWDLELTWSGFRRLAPDMPPVETDALGAEIEPVLRTMLKGLLRRFVSHEWIEQRMGIEHQY